MDASECPLDLRMHSCAGRTRRTEWDGNHFQSCEKTGLHSLYDYPMGCLQVPWLERIEYAQFLHDGSEIFLRQPQKRHSQTGDTHQIGGLVLPMKKPNVEIPVIEIWLKQ